MVELLIGEDTTLSPVSTWKAQQPDARAFHFVNYLRAIVHETRIEVIYGDCAGFRKYINTVKIGADRKTLAQINQSLLLISYL
jgi:hypothetical protein